MSRPWIGAHLAPDLRRRVEAVAAEFDGHRVEGLDIRDTAPEAGATGPSTTTAVIVDAEDPTTWLPLLGRRDVTLIDSTCLESQLRALISIHARAATGTRPPAVDDRHLRITQPSWRLLAATPFELTAVAEHAPGHSSVDITLEDVETGGSWSVAVQPIVVDDADQPQVRARFDDIDPEIQRRIARLATDARMARFIESTAHADGAPPGWWRPDNDRIGEVLSALHGEGLTLTLSDGAQLDQPTILGTEGVRLVLDQESRLTGTIAFSAAGNRSSVVGTGTLRTSGDGTVVVVDSVLLPDRRRTPRVAVSPTIVAGEPDDLTVTEVSAAGATVHDGTRTTTIGSGATRVRHRSTRTDGTHGVSLSSGPITRYRGESVDDDDLDRFLTTVRSEVPIRSSLVRFSADDQPLAGLWTECGPTSGPSMLLVVPPTWGRTKESTGLIAQFVATNFIRSSTRLGIIRFDYRNSRGESYIEPANRRPREEALGFTFRQAIADVEAAIGLGIERLGDPRVVVMGMSFSGPICLRVAVTDPRVDALAHVMAASDLQNLIRLATGGVDVVAALRSSGESTPLTVLGMQMNPHLGMTDALALDLAFLSSAQDDAALLDKPLLSITGEHDGFVDPDLVRTVIDCVPGPVHSLSVPCGHVPTDTAEAIATYAPLVAWMRDLAGDPTTELVVPDEDVVLEISSEEFRRAPRLSMPSAADYWRSYMTGDDEALGYEVLAMTAEYAAFMGEQVAALELEPGARIADFGSGLGHLLRHLPDVGGGGLDVHELELVPELLAAATAQATAPNVRVHPHVFDADSDELPEIVDTCDRVVLSLLLTALADPAALLDRLRRRLSPGTIVVASSVLPDADLSQSFLELVRAATEGEIVPPEGLTADDLVSGVRAYQNAAADLLRRAEEGQLRLYTATELAALLTASGFGVARSSVTEGSLACVVTATP